MGKSLMRPGFRFKPNDDELVMFDLKRKLLGIKFDPEVIAEVNINEFEPSDLPVKSILSGDREWYFFCPKSKKYKSGTRTNRATKAGYWKGTGEDKKVIHKERIVAMRKTLIFYESNEPKPKRTNWVMHEFRMTDNDLAKQGVAQDAYVVCRVFEKNDIGPNNGAQYGAPFEEKDWDDDDKSTVTSIMMVGVLVNPNNISTSSVMNITSTEAGPNASSSGPSTLIAQDNERLTDVTVNHNTEEVENRKRKTVEVGDRKRKTMMTDPVNENDVSVNDDVMLTNPNITSTEAGPSTVTSLTVVGLSGDTKMLDANASTSGPSTLIYQENERLTDVPVYNNTQEVEDHNGKKVLTHSVNTDDVMLTHGSAALMICDNGAQEDEDSKGEKVMSDLFDADCFTVEELLDNTWEDAFPMSDIDGSADHGLDALQIDDDLLWNFQED